jgi:hypothetical protein
MNYQPLVIQGPTTYCKEVAEYYKNYDCVWSTWDSEPKQNLEYLSSLDNVVLITDTLPQKKWNHYWGLYQFKTTLNGFKYLKDQGHSFGIKLRSDLMLNIPQITKLIDFDKFNCMGWHTHSVGYLSELYFAGDVNLICDVMERCVELDPEVHSENVLTYILLEEFKYRKIHYTLNDDLEFYCPKLNINAKSYMDDVRIGRWFNTTNVKQTSDYVTYEYTQDNFPDNYQLTIRGGPPGY